MANFDFKIYGKNGLEGVFDYYESIIWDMAYFDIGSCEINAPLTDRNLELLAPGKIIVNQNQAKVHIASGAGSRDVWEKEGCVIVSRKIDDEKSMIKAKGKSLEHFFTYRIIPQIATAESGADLVASINSWWAAAFPPMGSTNRTMGPWIVKWTDSSAATAKLLSTVAVSYKDAYSAFAAMTQASNPASGNHIFPCAFFKWTEAYDWFISFELARTSSGDSAPIFSTDFDNLFAVEIEEEIEQFSNAAFVAGEGEGADRLTVWSPADNVGAFDFNRREMFVDARDLKREDYTSDTKYREALRSRGVEKLVSQARTYGFEIPSESQYIYRENMYLGDVVKVKLSRYGVNLDVRIAGATETYGRKGYNCSLKFGVLKETLSQRINKRLR